VRVVGPRHYQDPNTFKWETLDSFVLVNAQLRVRAFAWLEGYLRARNLLDSNMQGRIGFPDPGRQFWIGLTMRWPDSRPNKRERP
jgi:outer membrane receptor protein involved in Fe transport